MVTLPKRTLLCCDQFETLATCFLKLNSKEGYSLTVPYKELLFLKLKQVDKVNTTVKVVDKTILWTL